MIEEKDTGKRGGGGGRGKEEKMKRERRTRKRIMSEGNKEGTKTEIGEIKDSTDKTRR